MPKELTHWTIARHVFEQMDDSLIKSSIADHREMYFIGAIAPDTPYYLNGYYRPFFQSLAEYLHGVHGENTYKPLGGLFQRFPDKIPPPVMAFICGILTHIMIDGEFHPLVYYLTGDYHHTDPAARNRAIIWHRRLEAEMDLYYSRCFETIQPAFLSFCLERKKISDEELLDLLCMLYFNSDNKYRSQTGKAIKTQAGMLRRFNNRTLYLVYRLFNILSQGRLYPVLALFYPPEKQARLERFEKEFEYVHPWNGEKRRERLEDIEKRVISRSLRMFEQWAGAESGRELAAINSHMVGPSLESGM